MAASLFPPIQSKSKRSKICKTRRGRGKKRQWMLKKTRADPAQFAVCKINVGVWSSMIFWLSILKCHRAVRSSVALRPRSVPSPWPPCRRVEQSNEQSETLYTKIIGGQALLCFFRALLRSRRYCRSSASRLLRPALLLVRLEGEGHDFTIKEKKHTKYDN